MPDPASLSFAREASHYCLLRGHLRYNMVARCQNGIVPAQRGRPVAIKHRLTPVDGSGRISLGKARAGTLYDVAYEADGRVTLTPMVALPEREVWLHKNPAAKAMVEAGLAELDGGKTVTIDLSQFPDDEE